MRREYFTAYWARRIYKALRLKPQIFYKRIKNWLGYRLCIPLRGWAPSPSGIFITITKRCNLSCKMCDYNPEPGQSPIAKYLSDEKELSLQDWKAFIDKTSAFRPDIFLVAAEPLLYKGVEELITYVKKEKKLLCSLATNGLLLKDFARGLVDSKLDYLEVSLDGPPHIHDKIRGKANAFNDLIVGIKKVQSLRGMQGKPRINVTYAISDYNFGELAKTMDILDSLNENWDSISFCHLSYLPKSIAESHNKQYPGFARNPRSISKVNPSNVDVRKLKEQIALIKQRKHKAVKFIPDLSGMDLELWYTDPLRIKNDKRRCSFPWINANVTPGGKVVPLVGCGDITFGDITQDSFSSIWNNQQFRNFRAQMRKVGKFPACFSCCSLK